VVRGDAAHVSNYQPVRRRTADQNKKHRQEREMYHRDVIARIARRLPHRTQRDVAEVIEVLTEVWSKELVKGEEIIVPNIGRLSIEVQDMKAGGALDKYGRLRRVYGRFRPTESLKERLQEVELE
jgi:nucleoid DNA-binding protein